MENLKALALL